MAVHGRGLGFRGLLGRALPPSAPDSLPNPVDQDPEPLQKAFGSYLS